MAGASQPSLVNVQQAELSYSAALAPPAFAMLHRWLDLQAAVLAKLAPYGLHLGDLKIESGSGNPSEITLNCWLLGQGTVVRYRLDRFEAWTNNLELARVPERAIAIVEQALEALRSAGFSPPIVSHTLTIALHGAAQEQSCDSRLREYVTKAPVGSLPLAPSGVSFMSDLPAGSGRGSVVFERSAAIADGVFLRVIVEQPGSVPERDALDRGIEFFRSAAMQLGFDLKWGQ